MNTLAVYYSRTGNNKALAEYINEKYGCDICGITTKRRMSGFGIFMSIIFRKRPAKIEKPDIDLSKYDNVILIAPVWAGCIAKPLLTFIGGERENLKKYSFASACGGENKEEIIADNFTDCGFDAPQNILQLSASKLLDEQYRKDISRLIKQRITKEEIEKFFEKDVEEFINKVNG